MHRIPTLPTGAPGVRLRHLVVHYYAFGPRAMLDLFERLVDGRLPDAMAVVEELEHGARIDPALVKAIGGYEFESRVFDLTQTFRARLPSEEPPSDASAMTARVDLSAIAGALGGVVSNGRVLVRGPGHEP